MKIALLLIASLLAGSEVCSQIAVEGFAGNQKTTADILFFKYFNPDYALDYVGNFFLQENQ
ncbi:MAG: hypothetical protein ACKOE5_06530 [Cytophagales bacterium]